MAPRASDAAKAAEYKPREIVTTFEGLVEALKRETEKLRAVDIYLNDEGKRRLRACETIKFLTGFCETAAELDALGLYDELGDDASAVRDVLMAIERIVKLEKGAKK
ncbi:MAG: hypothetical protein IJZ39_11715 [Oscillospiraceae bacterium]|nr:hypothetical protein [Oscillospiraceae bacterium]